MRYDMDTMARMVRSRFTLGNGAEPDVTAVYLQVMRVLSQARYKGSMEMVAQQMVEHVGLDGLLPEGYEKFQPLVTESMIFLLQQLPMKRLARKIVDQLMLAPDVSKGRRLCILIKDMPTLQKLGQIICRTPGLAPEFKQALVSLEDKVDTVHYSDLMGTIEKETEAHNGQYRFEIDQEILAEASVCAVVGADLHHKRKRRVIPAVLKVIKPNVRQNLASELVLFGLLADFLDCNKSRWGLGDFKFEDTLNQVAWLLENEVNLTVEQTNLRTADRYYPKSAKLLIPKLLPGSTPSMTVMTRVQGRKITDVDSLDADQKRRIVAALTETCILRPLKNLGDVTIFHADPHAGNIAYNLENSKPRIIFYDWGMMGRLNRFERFALAVMAVGVMVRSSKIVMFAAEILSDRNFFLDGKIKAEVHQAVRHILVARETWTGDVLTDINALIGELTYHGFVFPTNLLMFEKAMITLKGVIADIDPAFDDDQLIWIALGSQIRDLGRPRYHWQIYKECLALGRYSAAKLLRVHWLIIKLNLELGLAGIKKPLDIWPFRCGKPAR